MNSLAVSYFSADADATQEQRCGASEAVAGRMMIYDPHAIHAGGPNPDDTWWRRRLFLTFASDELSREDLEDMQRTNNLVGFKVATRESLATLYSHHDHYE